MRNISFSDILAFVFGFLVKNRVFLCVCICIFPDTPTPALSALPSPPTIPAGGEQLPAGAGAAWDRVPACARKHQGVHSLRGRARHKGNPAGTDPSVVPRMPVSHFWKECIDGQKTTHWKVKLNTWVPYRNYSYNQHFSALSNEWAKLKNGVLITCLSRSTAAIYWSI